MLIVFSDLHFVDGSAGDHNLPAAAYKKALRMVGIDPDMPDSTAKYLEDHGVTELKILFLGDIFDVVRSLNWFEQVGNAGPEVRPWGTDKETWDHKHPLIAEKTRGILLQMIPDRARGRLASPPLPLTNSLSVQKVFEVCDLFAGLKNDMSGRKLRSGEELQIEFRLIPGNHDRFLHTDPESRRLVIEALSLDETADAGFDLEFVDPDYNLIAMHGHEFDALNFGREAWRLDSFDPKAWGEPSFGEAVTIHVACKLAKYLKEESQKQPYVWTTQLQFAIENIDNIRPVSAVFDYLKHEQHFRGAILDEVVDRTIRRVAGEFADILFVREWAGRLGTHLTLAQALIGLPRLIKLFLKVKWNGALKYVLKEGLGKGQSREERLNSVISSPYFKRDVARKLQSGNARDVKHLVYGHTHVPEVQPLPPNGPAAMLINTGTMRPHIFSYGAPDKSDYQFLRHKTISFAAFYRKGEESSAGEQREYEFFHCLASEV